MQVSVIEDRRNPFSKRLLMSDSGGHERSASLLGAQAWLTRVPPTHPEDFRPSFSEHSVCIRRPDSIGFLVAHPTAEQQRRFLECLRSAGCILYDLVDHFALLPPIDQPAGKARLGRRLTANEEVTALKTAIDDDEKSQLINEVQFLLDLHHDGIVRACGIYHVKVEGALALGMLLDYKQGGDLRSWIPTGGLPEEIVRGIIAPLCDALAYLHRLPVAHRDVKPSNVLCDRAADGSVKVVLADFGLAAYAMDLKTMSRRCGTGGFIAPEMLSPNWTEHLQAETVTNITKIDVFSFGMLIYTAIFGNNPLVDVTSTSTPQRNVRALLSPSIMASRSDELHYLLSGLCAKNPHERFSTSEALAAPWFSSDRSSVAWAALEAAARG